MEVSRKIILDALAELCTAIRFLTILPISWRSADDPERFQKSVVYFPIIGLLIGAGGYVLAAVLFQLLPQPVVAALFVLYFSTISGFLHLDGLADSADGLLSAKPKDVSLEIMKDSRVGAMGVMAIAAVFLTKYSALNSISPEKFASAVILIPLAGKCSILFCMARLNYARQEGGIGSLFYTAESQKRGLIGIIGFVLLAIVLGPFYGLGIITTFFVINYLFCKFCLNRIGGATGDTLGAACELTEAAVAIAFTFLI